MRVCALVIVWLKLLSLTSHSDSSPDLGLARDMARAVYVNLDRFSFSRRARSRWTDQRRVIIVIPFPPPPRRRSLVLSLLEIVMPATRRSNGSRSSKASSSSATSNGARTSSSSSQSSQISKLRNESKSATSTSKGAERVFTDVVLSIKPPYVAAICDGSKNYEFRGYRLREGVVRLWLYETTNPQ